MRRPDERVGTFSENVRRLPKIYKENRRLPKISNPQSENYRNFTRLKLRLFSGLEILVEHLSLYNKKIFLSGLVQRDSQNTILSAIEGCYIVLCF